MFDRNQRAWVSKLAESRESAPTPVRVPGADHRPKPGDIVIEGEARHPSARYTIARLDKQPQLSCESRAQALKLARSYATRHKVDIWDRSNGKLTSLAPRGYGES